MAAISNAAKSAAARRSRPLRLALMAALAAALPSDTGAFGAPARGAARVTYTFWGRMPDYARATQTYKCM